MKSNEKDLPKPPDDETADLMRQIGAAKTNPDFELVKQVELDSEDVGADTTDIPKSAASLFGRNKNRSHAGPYKLLRPIGQGGMGEVWLAEQTEPHRTVAVKIIRPVNDLKSTEQRFELERQTLAIMNHPNIADIFDGGTCDDGSPFLVMEYIDGNNFSDYCARKSLSLDGRLRLFTTICDAIQHAHQKGIVHRDLKPSNVLVTDIDNKPVVKVIDFGLAKLVQNESSMDRKAITQPGQAIGTLWYMSPEQTRGENQSIDTRSDVYSLGVMLYELLVGSTPIAKDSSSDPVDIIQRIREEEAELPSRRLNRQPNSGIEVALSRDVGLAILDRRLRSEFDWIVSKAINKERGDRYGTVQAFSEDITRSLNGDAIAARPPTKGYVIRKFVSKNRLLVGSLLAIATTLLISTIGIGWFAYKAETSRQNAVLEKRLAQESAKRSNDVLSVVRNAFAVTDPYTQAESPLSAKDVIAQAQESLETSELDDRGKSLLLETLANCLLGLGEFDLASEASSDRIEILEAISGDSLELLKAKNDLGAALLEAGKYQKALDVFSSNVAELSNAFGRKHSETLFAMRNLANTKGLIGNHKEALAINLEILDILKQDLAEGHPELVDVYRKRPKNC